LRDVARACIYGVDRNPLAVELTKVALWIETVEPGKPLGFLDANIRCGDSLLGVFDLEALRHGIPDAAYKPLTGDDKETAKYFGIRNRNERGGQGDFDFAKGGGRLPAAKPLATAAQALRAMREDSLEEVKVKRRRFEAGRVDPRLWSLQIAADLYTAAFLVPKTGGPPANRNTVTIPMTGHVWEALAGHTVYGPLVGRAQDLAAQAHAFHWPLEFPDVIANGGFHVVLGNPPWERVKLQEQEFFAAREPEIANAPNAAARGKMIANLKNAEPDTRDRTLYKEFETAKRTAEAASVFARVPKEDCGRFPLTGRGDINTYALFAELFAILADPRGRSGVIVPTGIATDATTAPFFASLVKNNRLAQLIDFENRERIFPEIDSRIKFSLLAIGRDISSAGFAFFLTDVAQLQEPERRFVLSAEDIARINPNTKTAPVFRSRADAELTAKIYTHAPVLIDEAKAQAGNPWDVRLRTMFHKTNGFEAGDLRSASDLENLSSDEITEWLPVHEGDYGHQFDHRFGTFDGFNVRAVEPVEHQDPEFEPHFELRAKESVYQDILSRWSMASHQSGLLGFRRVARSTDDRTSIAVILPLMPLTYGWIVVLN
jgi:hypothetical protein